MEVLSFVAEIIRDLLIFVAVMTGLLIVLVVMVSKMPDTNPLKRVLTALTWRVGATAAAGALAVPIEPIPGLDVAYDVAVPILLIWYWVTLFRELFRSGAGTGAGTAGPGPHAPAAPSHGTVLDHDPRGAPRRF